MWPRVALWALSIAAIPAAKWVWDKILEQPPYMEEVAKINEAKRVREEQAKAELERYKKRRERILKYVPRQNGLLYKVRDEILFRKFDDVL